jgi:hypothetical protein
MITSPIFHTEDEARQALLNGLTILENYAVWVLQQEYERRLESKLSKDDNLKRNDQYFRMGLCPHNCMKNQ